MLVMTMEGMNEALLRPGRTDVKINHTNYTSKPEAVVIKLFCEADYVKRLWTKNFEKLGVPFNRRTPIKAAQTSLGYIPKPLH